MGNLCYPQNIGNAESQPASIMFSFYERESYKKSAPTDIIHLYMPEDVNQPATTAWDSEAFGFLGAEFTGQRGGGLGGGIMDSMSRGWGQAKANIASSVIGKMGGQLSAEAYMGAKNGVIPNPYVTMVFKGVDFRRFQMVFTFAPFTESDCTMIDNIVKTFRANSVPPGSGANKGPAFLGYPQEVEVKYLWKGKDNKWLHKFKRSVITGVEVDNAGAGMFTTMRNGFPTNTKVTLSLSEAEIVLRDDILKGGY